MSTATVPAMPTGNLARRIALLSQLTGGALRPMMDGDPGAFLSGPAAEMFRHLFGGGSPASAALSLASRFSSRFGTPVPVTSVTPFCFAQPVGKSFDGFGSQVRTLLSNLRAFDYATHTGKPCPFLPALADLEAYLGAFDAGDDGEKLAVVNTVAKLVTALDDAFKALEVSRTTVKRPLRQAFDALTATLKAAAGMTPEDLPDARTYFLKIFGHHADTTRFAAEFATAVEQIRAGCTDGFGEVPASLAGVFGQEMPGAAMVLGHRVDQSAELPFVAKKAKPSPGLVRDGLLTLAGNLAKHGPYRAAVAELRGLADRLGVRGTTPDAGVVEEVDGLLTELIADFGREPVKVNFVHAEILATKVKSDLVPFGESTTDDSADGVPVRIVTVTIVGTRAQTKRIVRELDAAEFKLYRTIGGELATKYGWGTAGDDEYVRFSPPELLAGTPAAITAAGE